MAPPPLPRPSAASITAAPEQVQGAEHAPATDLVVDEVRQVLSSPWCDRGKRTGHLEWSALPNAIRYEVDLVATDTCCDYNYASWPDPRWKAGRRLVVTTAATSDQPVDSTYFRLRAVAADGRSGPWTHGMWECWVE